MSSNIIQFPSKKCSHSISLDTIVLLVLFSLTLVKNSH